ncbi:AsmA-like C-terminal region-containing protein [Cochleicola gelatinilyticus]|uniref:Uncharacterized protein n=1 Tax=Cochleicola gelatinilyticus TaxID=1763537 RepID=A0A167KCS1_9FLAO|nr:AsmA-like C-terminal region-containing protein [Cochleicola gelatinilyticus]OAB81736.1 hypothetical protein ULVI_00705 [Cochleicola gelatinilyticus]
MKKFLKIIGIFLGVVLLLLALSPLFFKGTLEKLVKRTIDNNVNATVSWEDFDLSLFRSFPDAALTITNFSVINKAPFAGDTLASGKQLKLDMGITQLFKSGDNPIKIDALSLDEAFVNIRIDSTGQTNYDIAVKSDAPLNDDTEGNAGFSFDLKKYELKNSRINYLDESTQTFLTLTDVNHEGTGDFSLAESELDTETNALVSFRLGDIEYLKENSVTLDAVFQLDLENQKYTFLENEAKVNELPLTFNGFVKVNESNNEIDLTFKTPSSDFKNFLAVIPKVYAKNLDGVTTTGNFTVDGMLKGIVDDTYIPKMDIKIRSDNASFKYPDLPKTVRNISINADLKNETGLLKDTYLNIGGITFKIDDELFNANGSIRNLTENMLVNLALKGTLNLANIEKVFPIELDQKLSGVFKADVTTKFDMNSVEKEQYQNIETNGTASLSDFTYSDAAFNNPIAISKAAITMSPGNNISLNEIKATTGQTDIAASGSIQNLLPFLMSKQDLKGRFNVTSNTFNLNDFMASESKESKTTSEETTQITSAKDQIKIPDFLNATLDFSAKKVIYDNLELTNVKGTASIANETANLQNVTSNILGGNIAFGGNVSTREQTPSFAMELDLQKIDIDESFKKLEILSFFAPIAKALQGNLNTKINLQGKLNDDLTPQLTSLAGSALAQILTAEVDPEKTPLLSKLGEQIKFLNLDQLSLRDVSTALTFENGNIKVKPFDFNVKGIKVDVAGQHGLDKNMNYNVSLDVPARYLGNEVSGLLAKLDEKEANETTVKLPVGITGTFNNPKIALNTQAAVQELTQRLIERQTDKVKDKGKDIIKDILGGSTNTADTTKTNTPTTKEETTKVVKDILGGLFGKKKKDTTGN